MLTVLTVLMLVLGGSSGVAGRRVVQRAAEALPGPAFQLVMLPRLGGGAGGGHGLPFLSFHAHSLALVLPFTAPLPQPFTNAGSLTLVATFLRVGGNARVGVQDGQV